MKTIDQTTLQQWLDWDADGELGAVEKAQLEAQLQAHARLRQERTELQALHQAMAEQRINVDPEFKDRVMEALPAAAWEPGKAAWRLPLAVMLLCAVGASWLLAGAVPDNPVIGTGLAIVDFLQASALAGAGLLTASWRGVGMALEELFTGFDMALVALTALVICLNLLFFSMFRRRSAAKAEAVSATENATPPDKSRP